MGSLVAALASYLHARQHQGRWLVRIEDLDPPREQPGADRLILEALESLGLHWDGEVQYQSRRQIAYEAALAQLAEQNRLFYCRCSRQELQAHKGRYPGTCRPFTRARSDSAIRCRVDGFQADFEDLVQGQQQTALMPADDFVVRRRDGLIAYQLAVVVDDAWQDISHIIRGTDLLDSTPRQLYLQSLLGLPRPDYGHVPILLNADGQKLSKQHRASPLDIGQPGKTLARGLHYLGLEVPEELQNMPPDILTWATEHWQASGLQGKLNIPA